MSQMKWKELCPAVECEITPEEAGELLKLNTLEVQAERLREDRARYFASKIEDGSMRRLEIAIAVRKTKGKVIKELVNGQHSLHAIIMAGVAYPVYIKTYEAKDRKEVWEIYLTFDLASSGRTPKQAMSGHQALFSTDIQKQLSRSYLLNVSSALRYIGGGTVPNFMIGSGIDPAERANLVDRHEKDVLFVAQYCKVHFMKKIACLTAIMVTRRLSETAAKEFWSAVESGAMLAADDPRKKLGDRLRLWDGKVVAANTHGKKGLSSVRGRDRNVVIYQECIAWWNAWRTGNTRAHVKTAMMTDIQKAV